MNKKTNFFFKKKTYKFFLYTLLFIVIIFLVYLSIPKLFNYTPQLVEESLKKNSDFKIKNISKTNYHFFHHWYS